MIFHFQVMFVYSNHQDVACFLPILLICGRDHNIFKHEIQLVVKFLK